MKKDPTEFRDRFARWKAGEKVYENGLPAYGGGKGNPPLIPDLKSENTNDGFIPDFEEPVNTAAGLTVGGSFGVNPTKVADNVAASRLLNRTLVEDSAAKYGTRHFGDVKISPESFYKMYRDSAGFRTRYDRGFAQEGRFYNDNMDVRRTPIVKDSPGWTYNEDTGNYGGGGSSAYYTPQTNKIFIDSSNPTHEYFGGAKGVLAHELGHSVYNSATGIDFSKIRRDLPLYQYNLLSGKNKHNYRDAVNKMMSSDLRLGGDTADWSHDSNPAEGGADMTQLRYLLYKNGVFNSADSNAKIDAELLQNFYNQYKKDNPNVPYIRGIENYGIDKAAYLLNNTASLDKKFNRGNGIMLAKNGKSAVLPIYGGGKSAKKGSYYLPEEKIRRELDVPYDNSSYDYRRANQLGYEPDETGHLPSRDWITGRYLKTPTHPTESLAVYTDLGLGYDVFNKYGNTYSQPNWGSTWLNRLPGYKDGKPGSKRRYDYKYVQAGKDNGWERITDDKMSDVFLDFVARPKSRGGNTDTYNWNKQWTLKGEPGLEIVSPEFELLSGIRAIMPTNGFRKPISKPSIKLSVNANIAKDPYVNATSSVRKTSFDIAKESATVRELNQYAKMLGGNRISDAYSRIKSFLNSAQYKKRLEKYYRDKGSSIITQNVAPEDRIGELLYNIETSKLKIMPQGKLVDEAGKLNDSFGLYDPNSHSIQIASDAVLRQTPEHEMWHAARKARTYLDNEKYKMRVKSSSDPVYYGKMSELEVRVLDTLREMQESGLDINNLTDDQIWNFLQERPIDQLGTNAQSLIDNYWYDDVKRALRNFKGLMPPIITTGIGYGLYNKYAE